MCIRDRFMLVLFYSYVLAYRLQNLRKPERPQNIVGRAGRVYINIGDGRYTAVSYTHLSVSYELRGRASRDVARTT